MNNSTKKKKIYQNFQIICFQERDLYPKFQNNPLKLKKKIFLSPMTVLHVTANFGLVVISCAIICLQIIVTGFFVVGRARKKVFTKDFLRDNFGEEHEQYTNANIEETSGYPDMGNGRYSAKLDYNSWLHFNIAQRIHYNYLEFVASILMVTFLGGLNFPILASSFGFAYAFGRLLYSIFYQSKEGAKNIWRGLGAIICDLSFLVNFILAILCGVEFLTNGVTFEVI